MKFSFTPDNLAGAYEYLRTTRPFNRWRLPHADDVEFRVLTTTRTLGHMRGGRGGASEIAVSLGCVGSTYTLIRIVAHEMVHLYQHLRRTETKGVEHNAQWHKLADRVCAAHDFTRTEF